MFTLVANKTKTDEGFRVNVTAVGGYLDRPSTRGFRLGPNHGKLADRLVRAIHAGKVFTIEGVLTDSSGHTYLGLHNHVLGRTLNADLTRLGF